MFFPGIARGKNRVSTLGANNQRSVCGVGLAKQPDIPLQRAEELVFNPDLSNDVDDADERDKEQVGDEATGGKRTKGTFNTDMTMC